MPTEQSGNLAPLDYAPPTPRDPFNLRLRSAGVSSILLLLSAVACTLFGSGGLHAEFQPLPFILFGGLALISAVAIREARGKPVGEPPCRRPLVAERVVFWSAMG